MTVTQTNNSTNSAALFGIHQGWARLYTGNCATWTAGTQNAGGTGRVVHGADARHVLHRDQVRPEVDRGHEGSDARDMTYTFTTSLGGNTGASVTLRPS